MAHTTERAIVVLYAHPSLVTTIQAITAGVEETDENEDALGFASVLLECFPAEVQHAATTRRIIVHRRLAIVASVRAAQRKKYGVGGQAEPVTDFLEALGDAPGDVLRVIVEFVGEGAALEESGEESGGELEGERRLAGGKRGREE